MLWPLEGPFDIIAEFVVRAALRRHYGNTKTHYDNVRGCVARVCATT